MKDKSFKLFFRSTLLAFVWSASTVHAFASRPMTRNYSTNQIITLLNRSFGEFSQKKSIKIGIGTYIHYGMVSHLKYIKPGMFRMTMYFMNHTMNVTIDKKSIYIVDTRYPNQYVHVVCKNHNQILDTLLLYNIPFPILTAILLSSSHTYFTRSSSSHYSICKISNPEEWNHDIEVAVTSKIHNTNIR